MENKELINGILHEHEVTKDGKSLTIYVFTLLSFIAIISMNSLLYPLLHWYTIALAIPSGILLCRFFVIEHDCGHNSFFTKRKYNKMAGLILGFFTMVPSSIWNHIHNLHHGNVGNLNRRGSNPELWTMTVDEFMDASPLKRIAYRIFRSVTMRLIITPFLWMIIPRIPLPFLGFKIVSSVLLHNVIYAVILYFIIMNGNFLNTACILGRFEITFESLLYDLFGILHIQFIRF